MERILGPYLRPAGRKIVVIVKEDGCKTTKSYPKYLMEKILNRELLKNETVDHIDRDFTNDVLENLRVVDRSQHVKDDVKRVRLYKPRCVWCGRIFERSVSQLNHSSNRGKAGPFCSKKCAGEYGSSVQNNKTERLKVPPKIPIEDREYYYWEKNV